MKLDNRIYDVTGTTPARWSGKQGGAMTASPERSTHPVDPAVAGRARRNRTGIMILLHGLPQTGGGAPAVCAGFVKRRYRQGYVADTPSAACNIPGFFGNLPGRVANTAIFLIFSFGIKSFSIIV